MAHPLRSCWHPTVLASLLAPSPPRSPSGKHCTPAAARNNVSSRMRSPADYPEATGQLKCRTLPPISVTQLNTKLAPKRQINNAEFRARTILLGTTPSLHTKMERTNFVKVSPVSATSG
ncbi:uncharacterized protein LY79DRAFT_575689 [Colletotrichum navitas]|uniref:Uncharacterized protein n=1 Tax=Colletotrichum navitas TaxID=681940 RepID=A0AAD8QBX1_9PEZI|nr:uncharacterized protein LY79DRAFT_575689 [Colletotrichum navitas]KAK1599156.1 hypothetical protein LY79DRAFT_575689 [Colletotrichum navitas]